MSTSPSNCRPRNRGGGSGPTISRAASTWAHCFRVIPADIPDFQWAGFPEHLAQRLAHYRNGLVLFCGVAGSGKTTSLAMIVNLLNEEGGYRIITIEEPIEYVFPPPRVPS